LREEIADSALATEKVAVARTRDGIAGG
jgi:hypothetical protein